MADMAQNTVGTTFFHNWISHERTWLMEYKHYDQFENQDGCHRKMAHSFVDQHIFNF